MHDSDLRTFGPFGLDLSFDFLYRDGERLPLRPQAATLLSLLVRHSGRVVSREQIRRELWGEETHVDYEHGINACVRQIRIALDDSAESPAYLQTVPGKGYRFIAAVHRSAATTAAPSPSDAAAAAGRPSPPSPPAPGATPASTRASSSAVAMERSALHRRRGAAATLLGIAGLVVLGALLAQQALSPVAPASFALVGDDPPTSLVVGHLDNRTDNPELSRALETALRTSVAQSRQLRIVSQREVREELERMELPHDTPLAAERGLELARRQGAAALIVGRVVQLGSSFQLSAEVLASDGGDLLTAAGATAGSQEELLAAVDELSRRLRAQLGESLAEIDRTTPLLAQVTTSDLAALEAYSEARLLSDEHGDAALALLDRALTLDPDFAMAHARRAVLLRNRGVHGEALAAFRTAAMHRDRLTERERLYVDGWVATIEQRADEAIRSWSLMAELYPQYPEGHYNLGQAQRALRNDPVACARSLAAVVGMESPSSIDRNARLGSGLCLLAQARIDEARQLVRNAPRGDSLQLLILRSLTLAAGGDLAAAEALLERQARSLEGASAAAALHSWRGDILVLEGRFSAAEESLATYRNLVADNPVPRYRLVGDLVELALWLRSGQLDSRSAALLQRLERQLEETEPQLSFPHTLANAVLATLLAQVGEEEAAAAALGRSRKPETEVDGELWSCHRQVAAAELQLAGGRPEEAVAMLEDVLDEDSPCPLYAQESLARALEASGRLGDALARHRQVADGTGRVLVECIGHLTCAERILNPAAQLRSLAAVPRLHEALGEPEAALEAYRRLATQWARAEPGFAPRRQALTALQRLTERQALTSPFTNNP